MATLIFDQREITVAAMWDAYMSNSSERNLASKHGIDYRRFSSFHAAADVVGVEIDGEIAGGAMFNGRQMHLAIRNEYRSRWFKALKPLLEWAFETHGNPLFASVNRNNKNANKFIEQVGCVKSAEDENTITYQIFKERMRYGRNY